MKNRANDADALTVKDEAGIGKLDDAVKPDGFRAPWREPEVPAVGVSCFARYLAGQA